VAPGAVLDGTLPNSLQKRLRGEERLGNPDSGAGKGGGGAEKTDSLAAPAAPPLLLPCLPRRLQRCGKVNGG
jgi:hypothetical protein